MEYSKMSSEYNLEEEIVAGEKLEKPEYVKKGESMLLKKYGLQIGDIVLFDQDKSPRKRMYIKENELFQSHQKGVWKIVAASCVDEFVSVELVTLNTPEIGEVVDGDFFCRNTMYLTDPEDLKMLKKYTQ